jgi:hypothetical protein
VLPPSSGQHKKRMKAARVYESGLKSSRPNNKKANLQFQIYFYFST